jgi:CBS-domain-containing membrane protein
VVLLWHELIVFFTFHAQRVSGLPVVDAENKIVGSISASDLKGSTEESLFADVKRPLTDYLANSSRYFKRVRSSHTLALCPVQWQLT